MARFDKYDGMAGGFRAQLAVAINTTSGASSSNEVGIPLGVGVDASGLIVKGNGATGRTGVICVDQPKAIGDWVDVMTAGEIVDLDEAAFDPGVSYYSTAATGALTATSSGNTKVGFTVADKSVTTGVIRSRLVVRSAA
jgi:hypothetical protein